MIARWFGPMTFVALLVAPGCDDGDPGDPCRDCDGGWYDDATGGDDADAEAGTEGDADGSVEADDGATSDGTDGGSGVGPDLLYDGPRDAGAVVTGWDPDDPQPLIVFAKYDASAVWYVSMAEIDASGVVGGMVTERVRFWGWPHGSPDAPAPLYAGPLDATARIPAWSSATPLPVIVLTRYAGSTTWFASMATIDASGLVSGPVTDEIRVWGWTSGATGSPGIVVDGPRDDTAVVPGWSVADPRPLIVLTRDAADATWWLSMAEVSASGAVGGMITDSLRVWGW